MLNIQNAKCKCNCRTLPAISHFEFCIACASSRVGIDGRAFSSPAAGVRRYVDGLVPALLRARRRSELVALGGGRDAVPAGLGHVAEPPHPPTKPAGALVGLPRAAARAGVDLIHAPAYTAPFWSQRARRADDPRRQLRAASRVVSLPPRLAAARVLPRAAPARRRTC